MEMWVRSLGQEDCPEKELTTPSSILAWEIPWTEELALRSQRVRYYLVTKQQQRRTKSVTGEIKSWYRSVAKLYMTLCDPMDCSMPGFSILHYLLESAQIHIHWVGDAIEPSHPLSPLLLLPPTFPSIRVFSSGRLFTSGGQSIGPSASASVLPMNIQGWFPLGLTGYIYLLSKGLSRDFSTTVQKHQFFGVQLS